MIVGVFLEYADFEIRAGADLAEPSDQLAKHRHLLARIARPVIPDMHVEPDGLVIGAPEIQDLLLGREAGAARRALEVIWIGDVLAICESADDGNDGRILRPNRLGQRPKLFP